MLLTFTAGPQNLAPKAPQLRGAPSTPALRSSSNRKSHIPLNRKSESNLRNSNLIKVTGQVDTVISPRRAVYENLIGSAPGVIRNGDGWSSRSSGQAMRKTSSMASIRERALAFLRDEREPKETTTRRQIVDLAVEARHRQAQAISDTPGPNPGIPTGKSNDVHGKRWGFIGRLKGMVSGKSRAVESS